MIFHDSNHLARVRKSQTSFEFMVLSAFMLVVFIVFIIVIQQQTLSARMIRNEDLASQLASIINNEVVLANSVEPGYSRSFFLPPTLDGSNYSVVVENKQDLIINFRNQQYLFFLDYNTSLTSFNPGLNVITN